MLDQSKLPLDQIVQILRAAGETTRLRLLYLLSKGDLTVTNVVEILGQSQPRVSRHLKLLTDAGLLERIQEGAWAYYRLTDTGPVASIAENLLARIDPSNPNMARDLERLETLRRKRAETAAQYFATAAERWDEIRSLHADDRMVEETMLAMMDGKRINAMLDIGTGTGRVLELFKDHYDSATGVDFSREMLSVARANLDRVGLSRVQTRQGSIYALPTSSPTYDFVTIHQVLHFLDDPASAITEAAKVLTPSGYLMIVDFAPHELEFLREEHAHLRLGFSDEQIREWIAQANLEMVEQKKVTPPHNADGDQLDKLTVSVWLAKNPSVEVA